MLVTVVTISDGLALAGAIVVGIVGFGTSKCPNNGVLFSVNT